MAKTAIDSVATAETNLVATEVQVAPVITKLALLRNDVMASIISEPEIAALIEAKADERLNSTIELDGEVWTVAEAADYVDTRYIDGKNKHKASANDAKMLAFLEQGYIDRNKAEHTVSGEDAKGGACWIPKEDFETFTVLFDFLGEVGAKRSFGANGLKELVAVMTSSNDLA